MQRQNIRSNLLDVFPADVVALIKVIQQTAVSLSMPLYTVGGPVRDLLLSVPPADLDIIVEGSGIALANELVRQFGGKLVVHQSFGTAVWHLDSKSWSAVFPQVSGEPTLHIVDFITARREVYHAPAALPTVTPSNIDDDLARRDFTINTMAIRLDGSAWGDLFDPFNGRQDLQERTLRVLHDKSFIDDPTRILRGARYTHRLGLLATPQTSALLQAGLPFLQYVSGIRLWHEFEWIFREAEPAGVIARLHEWGALAQIETALSWSAQITVYFIILGRRLEKQKVTVQTAVWAYLAVWMYNLTEDAQARVLNRLDIPQRVQAHLLFGRQSCQALKKLPQDARPSQIVPLLQGAEDWLLLAFHTLLAGQLQADWLTAYETRWHRLKPTIDGFVLLEMGVPQGPKIGQILNQLRVAWLDNVVTNELEEAKFLEVLLKN